MEELDPQEFPQDPPDLGLTKIGESIHVDLESLLNFLRYNINKMINAEYPDAAAAIAGVHDHLLNMGEHWLTVSPDLMDEVGTEEEWEAYAARAKTDNETAQMMRDIERNADWN